MARCKCRNAARIVSDVVQNICQTNNCMSGAMNCGCTDVCVNPSIGTPDTLGLFAPVIYDEAFLFDGIIAVLAGVLLWVSVLKTKSLRRPWGIVFLVCYGAYLVYLLI